jgi:hypothetical protein
VDPAEFKIQIKSKIALNLIPSKHYHPSLQEFEINYHEMWFELKNKLCHWSIFKFKKEFELKIRELKGVESFQILIELFREFKNDSDLAHNSLITPSSI